MRGGNSYIGQAVKVVGKFPPHMRGGDSNPMRIEKDFKKFSPYVWG